MIKKNNVLIHKSYGKNYQWKTKKLIYRKEILTMNIRRIYNPDFKEYELKIDGSQCGYISQGEDKTYTPYYEEYDQQGRLVVSVELEDSIALNTAISRIVRKKKGQKKYDNYKRRTP